MKGTATDPLVGRSWEIPMPEHVGHTLTVVGRDTAYPGAYVIECSCGLSQLLGEYWAQRYAEERPEGLLFSPYDNTYDHWRRRQVVPSQDPEKAERSTP